MKFIILIIAILSIASSISAQTNVQFISSTTTFNVTGTFEELTSAPTQFRFSKYNNAIQLQTNQMVFKNNLETPVATVSFISALSLPLTSAIRPNKVAYGNGLIQLYRPSTGVHDYFAALSMINSLNDFTVSLADASLISVVIQPGESLIVKELSMTWVQ
ncbi:hypothetical protein PPL_07923 [Heterostelium album PN500]|uniref:Uncharacterized protein n=1 Tax=Heterostelium pallidum (strain ATCC 26659 / Pp 5 / PN500) TaxID=670386 RepID=D3BHC1_HETP5|nr:hypothetical protein PPL_07923 [Heterostelium album PN500]EFA79098.1 hypothetical protein PPL_07923 [Heterostelium album PN500]|eukprot:XP_020431220.1 hypothetical protein PPL_07923 [Heterostelium album PN500]